MRQFEGRAQFATVGSTPFNAVFVVDEERLRLRSGSIPIESWRLADIAVTRQSLFRFQIDVGEDTLTFAPEDPTGFGVATNAYIDLRANERFGLAERLRRVESGGALAR